VGCADESQELGTLGLKPWLQAAKKRLHHNVLAIALANKLARIAWTVLAQGRSYEARAVPGTV
jgi:transposase